MAIHGTISVVLAFVLTVLSTIIVGLRFYCRHFLLHKLSASDWVMLLALIAAWGSVVINWYVVHFIDYNDLNDEKGMAYAASRTLLFFWIYRISYILDLCLIKISILIFYRRIAASRKQFQYVVRGLMTVILLGGASMIFAAVFTCYPVEDAWSYDVFESAVSGVPAKQCYNPAPFWLFNASYNLITDVLLWIIPVIFLLQLSSMPLRRRLELIAIFSLGLLAIIASAVRLRVMVLWLSDFEQRVPNTTNLLIWSQLEQHAGILAASIPFIRPLYMRAVIRGHGKVEESPSPVVFVVDGSDNSQSRLPRMFRPPIIPSPSPTFDECEKEFQPPRHPLPPIEPVRSTWGTTVWDGTQVRQVLLP